LEVGWAKVQEIRKYLTFFKESGKDTIAYLERASEKEYYLATACKEIYVPPTAQLSLRGLSVGGVFLRGVFDKVGVEPQVKRIGKYKSAGDQLLRKDMSEAQREQLTALLDDIYSEFLSTVSEVRMLHPPSNVSSNLSGNRCG
jgi:protease IV